MMAAVGLLAWPLTVLVLVSMVPWARWFLNRSPSDQADLGALALTTLALSVGALSLIMLGIGMLGIALDWRVALALDLLLSAAGWLVWWRTPNKQPLALAGWSGPWRFVLLIVALLTVLIVFNAVYWPIGIDDAVTIYASFGKRIALSGQLPRGNLYETYPMLVPLAYAFTHQMAGWINEYLAALVPALLSVGVIGVAYLLGKRLYNGSVGILAALLVALTPMITHWASTGYVDLPAGFFYGLAAYFLLRADDDQPWQDALLAGIMAGLSAWTKNSGLLIVLPIGLWWAYRLWQTRRFTLRIYALICGGFAAVAGPWYLRNLALAALIVPPTGWTWKAERSLTNLLPYLIDQRYSVIGWLLTAGLLWTIWQAVRLGKQAPGETASTERSAVLFLLAFYVPFFAVWWALFSYDGRFLLVLTPFIAVMGARLILQAVQYIQPFLASRGWLAVGQIAVLLVIVGLAVQAANAAVDYKPDLLRHPFMSDADKHRLRLGTDRYNMALYIATLPTGTRTWTQDLLLPYHAYRTASDPMVVGNWPAPDQLSGFDYWVISPGNPQPQECSVAPAHREGSYALYKVSEMVQGGQFMCRFG